MTDEDLILQWRHGDHTAGEQVVCSYSKRIYGFVRAMVGGHADAQDVTQEVFVKIWRHLRRFDHRKSAKAWIFKIARTTALDALKKKKTVPFSDLENEDGESVVDAIIDPAPLPSEWFDDKEKIRRVTSMVELLPLRYRVVLQLRYGDDLTFREIAEVLGEPLDTVKSRHLRGVAQIKKLLKIDT